MPLKEAYTAVDAEQAPGEIYVSGEAANAAASILHDRYYFRDGLTSEIADICYADGTLENLKAAVKVVADKAEDPYTRILGPKDIAKKEERMNGIKDASTRERFTVFSTLLPAYDGVVGYVQMEHFHRGSAHRVRRHLSKLSKLHGNTKPLETVVVDLRGNPGGSTSEADTLLETFMPEPGYLLQKHPEQSPSQAAAHNLLNGRKNFWGDLVFLVDGKSSSASNTLAGVSQEAGRAKVVGEKSHNKSFRQSTECVQACPTIQLKYTDANILLRNGHNVHQNGGLDPDFTVEDITSGVPTYNDHFDRVMFDSPISLDKWK